MPWTEPDPFGVCHYRPTDKELVADAVNSFSWLFWPRKAIFTCGELADLMERHVSLDEPRNAACYKALRKFNTATVRLGGVTHAWL